VGLQTTVMTLQRRGGISVERLPMGLLLDGGQTKSMARQKTGAIVNLRLEPLDICAWVWQD